MGHFYFLLGLGGLLLLAFGLNLHRRFGRRARLPYVADETLFTPPQRAFLAALEEALGPEYRVYGRVRVAEVIALRPRLDRAARRRAWALLGDRQFDFLVCSAATSALACAVNLAPRSRRRRPPPQDTLDCICDAAGLPFVRFREADHYAAAQLEQSVFGAMQAKAQLTPAPPVPARMAPRHRSAAQPLYSLSEVAVEDAREPHLRPVPAPPRVPAQPPARVAPAPAALTAVETPRIEPILAGHGDLDPGPAFHIDGGLDDEDDRPLRARER